MAAEQLTDKENQFRKRARRRLVGAVALVLLMITVLPMVLDDRGSQKGAQPEIAISIPSQDGSDFSSRIVPVAPQPAATTPPVQLESPVAAPAETQAPAKPVVPVPVAKPAEPKPAVVAPVPEEKRPAAVPVETPKPAQPAPAKIVVEPKPQPKAATPVKKGSFSVQIGVFSDAGKVKQMRDRIAEKGIPCYTENMNTPKGTKIRVRCGPYSEKAAAQQALDTLKASGHSGILVTNQ